MSETGSGQRAAAWMYAEGDPPGTVRYWNGTAWQGDPQPVAPPVQPGPAPAIGAAGPTPPPVDASGGWSGTKKTVVAMAVAVVLIAGVAWWTFTAGRAQAEVANEFMDALAANDYNAAAALLSDDCGRPEARTAAALQQDFTGFDIVGFELELGTVGITNSDQTGIMVGTVTVADGRVLPIELSMVKQGDWKVCTYGR